MGEPMTIEEIVADIIRNPERYPTEARLILRLFEVYRERCDVRWATLEGEVESILLYEDRSRSEREYAILPKSVPVVIHEVYNCEERREYVHIFTKDGWKTVRVY
jgi:hypothetical protein